MTNQEVIEWFRTKYAKVICDDCKTPVGMAISALQAQDAPDINVDTISRQAAIDTEGLDAQIRCEMCRNPMHTDRGCDGNCKYDEKLYEKIMQILGERIKPLPYAQPERCSDCIVHGGDWECDHMHCRKGRLPSAQPALTAEEWKLVKQLRSYHNGSYAQVLDKLIAAASQPAIIHCRDCKHYYFADNRVPQEQMCVCDLDGDR